MILVTATAALVVVALHAPDKWFTGILETMVTFGGMLSFFRRDWSSKRFWTIMGIAFLAHLLLMWWVLSVALRRLNDVGFLACLPFILLEGCVLYHAVRFFSAKR